MVLCRWGIETKIDFIKRVDKGSNNHRERFRKLTFRALALRRSDATVINLKKADKGTTTVITNKADKIYEAKVQLDNRKHYERLKAPMVKTTQETVNDLISRLHQGEHIDDMTKKWLLQTPNPPRIPIFYTLTKIYKPKPVGRPIISGCDGPTERISSFVDTLLQPIAQKQQSFIKDKPGYN